MLRVWTRSQMGEISLSLRFRILSSGFHSEIVGRLITVHGKISFRSKKFATCSVRIISHVTFKSFLPLEICVGNTIETSWACAMSSVFRCISVANTNFKKLKFPGYEGDATYDFDFSFAEKFLFLDRSHDNTPLDDKVKFLHDTIS